MPPNRKPPSLWVQLFDLLLIELTNWRWSWRSMIVVSTVAPVLGMLGLGIFGRDSGPQALAYIMTGNVVLALMFGNLNSTQSHFVYMRFAGSFDYFATLPLKKEMLILAATLAFTLFSLPSLIITVLAGALFLQVPLQLSPIILLVVPLCAISMAGIGAFIGISARTPQEAGSLASLLSLLMLGLGPVVIPPDRLPTFMLFLGRFSPATYAASALRQALIGPVTRQLIIDLGVLLLFTVASFTLVSSKMDWRQR